MAGARMTIRVVKPGFFTTVQDRGRFGYAHLGISPAGAADPCRCASPTCWWATTSMLLHWR